MFGFGSKIPYAKLAADYVQHSAEITDDTFQDFIGTFLQSSSTSGVDSAYLVDKLNKFDLHYLYFSLVCASGAIPIRNLFKSKDADRLYEAIIDRLKAVLKAKPWVADVVASMWAEVERQKVARPLNSPIIVVLWEMMKLMRLHEDNATLQLFNSPFLQTSMQVKVLSNVGWWKPVSERYS